uniref:Uncharacterized protein n=1 Tax=Steinernema glaseri TaxID=37863 RepID=A0A1I7Z6V1_9BILA
MSGHQKATSSRRKDGISSPKTARSASPRTHLWTLRAPKPWDSPRALLFHKSLTHCQASQGTVNMWGEESEVQANGARLARLARLALNKTT